MPSLVQRGNTIHVPVQSLGGNEGKKINVSWNQSLRSRNEEYWVCTYTVTSGGDSQGIIFVQNNKLEEFKHKRTAGDEISVVVDDSFQYGQDKDQNIRFLVYHDKGNKLYQHRFLENTFTALGSQATGFLDKFLGNVTEIGNATKGFIGDYLKNF